MKSSLQSIRLTGVPMGRTETQIQEEAQTDAARTHTPPAASIGHFFSKGTENAPSPSRVVLQIGLATQKDRQTATITFAN
jgi:hypothetical protein